MILLIRLILLKSFLNYLFVSYFTFIRFSMNIFVYDYASRNHGGLKWTRTTDLALIRRAL